MISRKCYVINRFFICKKQQGVPALPRAWSRIDEYTVDPIDFRKNSKNPIQKSKLFNFVEMFEYKTMPDTEKITADLNGRVWEEFWLSL